MGRYLSSRPSGCTDRVTDRQGYTEKPCYVGNKQKKKRWAVTVLMKGSEKRGPALTLELLLGPSNVLLGLAISQESSMSAVPGSQPLQCDGSIVGLLVLCPVSQSNTSYNIYASTYLSLFYLLCFLRQQ